MELVINSSGKIMNKSSYIKYIIFTLFLSLLLVSLSLLFVHRLSSISETKFRDRFLLNIVTSLESSIENNDLISLEKELNMPLERGDHKEGPPPMHDYDGNHPPPPRRRPSPEHKGHFWIVSPQGEILYSNNKDSLPKSWDHLNKSEEIHKVSETVDFFRLFPSIEVIRLKDNLNLYFVAHDPNRPLNSSIVFTQAIIIFITVFLGFLISLSFLFYYLRQKSNEAKKVIRSLAHGDLGSRFKIKKFDDLGGLLLEFNNMASQIEELVQTIHKTESKRKKLIQELGHDLKTPLTALQASAETLKNLEDKMSKEDRRELIFMIEEEARYFAKLLENLMLIASFDEPKFKSTTKEINLYELIQSKLRQYQIRSKIDYQVFALNPQNEDYTILGDPHLLDRLFSNIFSNAGKYAKSFVKISMNTDDHFCIITIHDDGEGLSQEQVESFGIRKNFSRREVEMNGHLSLGLGSVIIKSIVEVHKGSLEVRSHSGLEMVIKLPRIIS